VHRRETSNVLDASVCCEQKRLQRLSIAISANNQIKQLSGREFQTYGPATQKPIGHNSSAGDAPHRVEKNGFFFKNPTWWVFGFYWAVHLGTVRWQIGDVAAM